MTKSSEIFEEKFGEKPDLYYWSSGRVNIIGEHTDYHDGFVMPAAIDLGITWSVKKNGGEVRGYTEKFDEMGQFAISSSERTKFEWMQYLQGVVEVLKKRGCIPLRQGSEGLTVSQAKSVKKFGGVDFAIHSTIPIGSGLSSSSSLATGFTFILNDIYDLGFSRKDIAQIACEAEWWYGTNGGIMDQYCIANGEKGSAIMIDCRALAHEIIPIPKNIELVVFETTIRHKQINSPYALRREQAHEAVSVIKKLYKNKKVEKMRDVTMEMLDKAKPEIIKKYGKKEGEIIYKRSKHPITENERVLKMKGYLANDNFEKIGETMAECHKSLKDDYEVSCKELDEAVKIAQEVKGLIGCRMIGGGFGGCTLNLVKKGTAQHFAGELEELYRKKTGIKGNPYICNTHHGLEIIK